MTKDEYPGPRCNCGRLGCIEQFLSGPAKNRERDAIGEEAAMARFEDRLARAFSMIINVLDPDVIVVGGGMSKHDEIYTERAAAAAQVRLPPRAAHADRARRARRCERGARRGDAMAAQLTS